MKKTLIFLFFLLICCGGAGILAACTDNSGGSDFTDAELTYSVNGNSTVLSWDCAQGAKYSVYRAESRFGDFILIADNLTEGSYTDDSRGGYYRVVARDGEGRRLHTFEDVSEEKDLLGENVYVFSPADSAKTVNNFINNVYNKQYKSEFSSERYAIYFKPGRYDESITLKQSYYTTFAGLGSLPEDVSVSAMQNPNGFTGNALINFWRGTENISFRNSCSFAVSQGTYLRGIKVNGNLTLHDNGGYASGGFLADSYISGQVASGSQQQWFTRNCNIGGWSGQVWNMCFSGVSGAPSGEYPDDKYTVVDKTPVIREKPYLVLDDYGYRIAVPSVRENSAGCSWTGSNPIKYLGGDEIYFAKADTDNSETINAALSEGKHILFTPGIYRIESPLNVTASDTVLLGTGLATLTPVNGNACIKITAGSGVCVAGILFDAGEKTSDSLLEVGTPSGGASGAWIYDCFFRVGGASDGPTSVETCLKIYADGTVCDNIWLWRADHGSGVGWDINDGATGMQVYGNNVKAYALFAEHYKKHNVLWSGENGLVIFYQSELAYDVPSQDRWLDGDRNGYASFAVSDSVQTFKAYGLGIYSNFYNADIVLHSAMRVPEKAGIEIRHICAVALSKGLMENVINGIGGYIGGDEKMRFVAEVNFK